MRVKLWFSGNPIPKGRPRVGMGQVYTPGDTLSWENTVGWQARDQWKRAPLLGPLGIEFVFYRENRRKVDLDNLQKAMLDGLQGILFKDDSQIKLMHSELNVKPEMPGVEVEIWTL